MTTQKLLHGKDRLFYSTRESSESKWKSGSIVSIKVLDKEEATDWGKGNYLDRENLSWVVFTRSAVFRSIRQTTWNRSFLLILQQTLVIKQEFLKVWWYDRPSNDDASASCAVSHVHCLHP